MQSNPQTGAVRTPHSHANWSGRLRLWLTMLTAAGLASCQMPPENWRNLPVAFENESLWMKPHLTWTLDTTSAPLPPGLSHSDILAELDVCFQQWADAGVFTFTPTGAADADIVVRFTDPPDGRFDGRAGRMTRGFFPWAEHRGQIYLDPAERWTTALSWEPGVPIAGWVPHQIAHVLGLRDDLGSPSTHLTTLGPQHGPDEWALYELRQLYTAGAE